MKENEQKGNDDDPEMVRVEQLGLVKMYYKAGQSII